MNLKWILKIQIWKSDADYVFLAKKRAKNTYLTFDFIYDIILLNLMQRAKCLYI